MNEQRKKTPAQTDKPISESEEIARPATPEEWPPVDAKALVTVSDDRMEGHMILHAPKCGGKHITEDMAHAALQESGIAHGLDWDQVRAHVRNNIYGVTFRCAQGTPPINGVDGSVTYTFPAEDTRTPDIRPDGSVDYKNLNLIPNVEEGQLLATATRPAKGTPGTSVLGKPVPQIVGRPAAFRSGKNTTLGDDGLTIRAAVAGQVILDDGKVMVDPVYEVRGDVDTTTGNIRFNGKVVIAVQVPSGYTVETEGDIEVWGGVEGAHLNAGGNIILHQGIQGNNQAQIQCKGNLVARFIENSQVDVNGNVEAGAIMHSTVNARGSVITRNGRGLIVGGTVRAGQAVDAISLGSAAGTATVVEVGMDPQLKIQCQQCKSELEEVTKQLDQLDKTITILNRMSETGELTDDKRLLKLRSLKTYGLLRNRKKELAESIRTFEKALKNQKDGKVHARRFFHAGVRITIHNSTLTIRSDLSQGTAYYEHADVVIGPYRG